MYFCVIVAVTFLLQAIMVQFGGPALACHEDGLDGREWGWCLLLGAGSLVWQQVVNVAAHAVDGIRLKRKAP